MVDWPGLLKWTLTQSDGTTADTSIKPMTEEEKKWLQEAIEAYTFDEAKRMREILEELKTPEKVGGSEEEAERRLTLVEEFTDLVEGLENARDLIRMKVYDILLNNMFNSQYPEVRKQLYFVFASCNSLNTFVQETSVERGCFKLINCIIKETSIASKEAAFAALSSLVRGESLSIKRRFIDIDGLEFLLELLKNDQVYNSNKIRIKVMTLLQDLVFYDDKLDYEDIIAFNKNSGISQKEVGNKTTQHISLKSDEEKKEGSSNNEKSQLAQNENKENLASYKNAVKKKLLEKDFIDFGLKFITEENLLALSSLRTAYFSIVINLLQFDKSYKPKGDYFERIEKFSAFLNNESKQNDNLYGTELDLLQNLLALKN